MKRENFSYILRSVAGFYLIYLAYQLIGGSVTGENTGIFPVIAGVLFAAVGVGSIFTVVKGMISSRMPQESEIEKQFDSQKDEEVQEVLEEQEEAPAEDTEEK